MELETRRFYEKAASRSSDAPLRELLFDLAQEERSHETRAQQLEIVKLPESSKEEEDQANRKLFVLQIVQPGLAGLMDGSVSTLAPVFAAAFATRASTNPSFVDFDMLVGTPTNAVLGRPHHAGAQLAQDLECCLVAL